MERKMSDIERVSHQPALVEAPFRGLEELVFEGFLGIHVARLVLVQKMSRRSSLQFRKVIAPLGEFMAPQSRLTSQLQ